MLTSRYSPEQIAAALRQVEAGTSVAEIVRKLGRRSHARHRQQTS